MSRSDTNGRRDEFAIQINGVPFVKGDPDSVRVMFFNLNGRNFEDKPKAEYSNWLDYIAKEYETTLSAGDKVEMLSPDGVVLDSSAIGVAYVEKQTETEQPRG